MKRYVIERDVPGIGGMNGAQYKDVAKTSNSDRTLVPPFLRFTHELEPREGP